MLEQILAWLTGLPGAAMFIVLALVAAIENVFPPFPADMVVAFGGFLAARAQRSLIATFLVVWAGNVAGAMLMYGLGRRYGAGPLIARMGGGDAERAQARLQALYGRYGTLAILVSRFLPGVRGFVPPLAGAAKVPAPRTAVVMALASAVWYGGICYLAYRVGDNWDALREAVTQSGRWIGIAAIVVAALGAAAWFVHRRRRTARDAR